MGNGIDLKKRLSENKLASNQRRDGHVLVAIDRRICQGAGDRYAAIAEAVWRYRTSDSKRTNSFLTTA